MTDEQIFFNKKKKSYYYNSINLNCSICNILLTKNFFLTGYNRLTHPILHVLCYNCKDIRSLDFALCFVEEQLPIKISKKIPEDSEKLTSYKIYLTDKFNSMTCFDVFYSKEAKHSSTIDRTIFSFRGESLEGAKIGLDLNDDYLDKFITSEKEFLFLLNNLAKAESLIEYKSTKRITFKEKPQT